MILKIFQRNGLINNMKHLHIIRHIFILLLAFTSCLLLGCGGCASHEKASPKEDTSTQESKKETPQEEVQWNLSAEATATYVYLLYDQALRQNDKETLIYALKELASFKPPVTAYIDAGIQFMNEDPNPILPLLQLGLQTYPDNVSLNLLNAELLQKAGKSAEAIARIREFIARHPQNIDAKLELALLLVNTNMHQEAENILNSITGAERTALVEYYHAKALIGMRRAKEAVPYLEKALIEMPHFTEALVDIASIYEQENNFAKARDIYENILDQQGFNPEIILRLVYSSLRLKEPERALEYYEEGPVTPALTATIGSMLVEEKYYDLAEPLLQKLTTLPDAPQELYFYLAAIAYERDHDTQKTYDLLSNIKEDHADYARAMLLRLQLLIDMEKFEEALDLVVIVQGTHPDRKEFHIAQVRILATLDRMDESIKLCKELMNKWPDDSEISFLYASLLDESGDKKGALATMEAIVLKNPNHHQALNYIGYTLAEENRDLKRALVLLRKAVALSPSSDYILDSLAWALYKSKQLQEAWRIISTVITMHKTEDPIVWEHYGDIASALGKKQEARKGYEKALEYKPSNAESIKKRLADL